MNGAEHDAGKSMQRTTAGMTPPGPPRDYLAWFAGAAQRMLLLKADIKQHVANHGRLPEFEAEMVSWGVRFNGDGSSLAEGSEVLFGICERFELLKFVGSPQGGGPSRTRGAVRGAVRGAHRGAPDNHRLVELRRELARGFGGPR